MEALMQPEKSPGKKMKVVCPVERKDGKTRWVGCGVGFINRDASINLYLDVLPVNGKLQLREWDDSPPPWERRDGGGHTSANGGGHGGSRDRVYSLPMAQPSGGLGQSAEDEPF